MQLKHQLVLLRIPVHPVHHIVAIIEVIFNVEVEHFLVCVLPIRQQCLHAKSTSPSRMSVHLVQPKQHVYLHLLLAPNIVHQIHVLLYHHRPFWLLSRLSVPPYHVLQGRPVSTLDYRLDAVFSWVCYRWLKHSSEQTVNLV